MYKFATLAVVLAGLVGCGSSPQEGGLALPETAGIAVGELRRLQGPIMAALRDGNPAACDEQLHAAMYYADYLPEIARRQDIAADRLQAVTRHAEQLFSMFKEAHDGAHGGATRDADRFAADMSAALDAIEAAVP